MDSGTRDRQVTCWPVCLTYCQGSTGGGQDANRHVVQCGWVRQLVSSFLSGYATRGEDSGIIGHDNETPFADALRPSKEDCLGHSHFPVTTNTVDLQPERVINDLVEQTLVT